MFLIRSTTLVSLIIFLFFLHTEAPGAPLLARTLHRIAGPAGSQFGFDIDLEGNLAIIAAINRGGRAFLFDVAKGSLIREYFVGDGIGAGHSVAIESGVVAVGRYSEDVFERLPGSVYLFDRDSGELKHRLSANDEEGLNLFGSSIDIDQGNVLVGAGIALNGVVPTGAAYVFDAETGQQLHKLVPLDFDANDFIGYDVALDGDVAIVGAPQNDLLGMWAGAAFLFNINTGLQTGKLLANDGKTYERFGEAVDIEGRFAIVGAPAAETGAYGPGAAYVFDITTGNQLFKLEPNGTTASFGGGVAIHGDIAVVSGSTPIQFGGSATSTYLYDLNSGNLLAEINRTDLNSTDITDGRGVALNSTYLLIGTELNSVFVYIIPEPATASLMLIGLSLATVLRRRSERQK